MGFDFQWVAPNGVPIVAQTVKFPDGTRQLLGVYMQGISPPSLLKGSRWSDVSGLVTYDGGTQADFADTAARADFLLHGGNVLFYFDGPPTMSQAGQTSVIQQAGSNPQNSDGKWVYTTKPLISNPGWYARSGPTAQTAFPKAFAAYQWGVQQLASQGATASSIANAPPGAAPTPAQNVPPPPPNAPPPSSSMSKYLLLGAAAAGAWFFLK